MSKPFVCCRRVFSPSSSTAKHRTNHRGTGTRVVRRLRAVRVRFNSARAFTAAAERAWLRWGGRGDLYAPVEGPLQLAAALQPLIGDSPEITEEDRIISSLWSEQCRRYDCDSVGTPVGYLPGCDNDGVLQVVAELVAKPVEVPHI